MQAADLPFPVTSVLHCEQNKNKRGSAAACSVRRSAGDVCRCMQIQVLHTARFPVSDCVMPHDRTVPFDVDRDVELRC